MGEGETAEQGPSAESLADALGAEAYDDLRFATVALGRDRAEALLAAVERLLVKVQEAERALAEAIDLAEEGWAYASPYFAEKWDAAPRVARLRAVLGGDGEQEPKEDTNG